MGSEGGSLPLCLGSTHQKERRHLFRLGGGVKRGRGEAGARRCSLPDGGQSQVPLLSSRVWALSLEPASEFEDVSGCEPWRRVSFLCHSSVGVCPALEETERGAVSPIKQVSPLSKKEVKHWPGSLSVSGGGGERRTRGQAQRA